MGQGGEASSGLVTSERRGFINVIVLGISFCVLFVAFSSTQNLQTNLHGDLGSRGLSILYLVFAPANFVSPYVVTLFGEKLSLIFGAVCYCVFIAANVVLVDPLFYGASAIIGFGAAVLWTAQGSVVLHSAPPDKLGAYNGVFFGIFQWAQVIGNLTAGVILSKGISTLTLFLVLTIVGSSSLIGFFFVQGHKVDTANSMSVSDRLSQTIRIIGDKHMVFLYLAMIYSGISQTYMFGVYPGTRPKKEVGYIMAVFGGADVIGSFVAGYVSDKLGRLPIVFTCALSLSFGSIIFYLQTISYISDATYLSYIIAVLLGIADSGFNTQIYATLGDVFPDRVEAAIGAFKFFQAGSTAVLFFVGPYINTMSERDSQLLYFVIVNVFVWTGTLTFFALSAITRKHKGYTQINDER